MNFNNLYPVKKRIILILITAFLFLSGCSPVKQGYCLFFKTVGIVGGEFVSELNETMPVKVDESNVRNMRFYNYLFNRLCAIERLK